MGGPYLLLALVMMVSYFPDVTKAIRIAWTIAYTLWVSGVYAGHGPGYDGEPPISLLEAEKFARVELLKQENDPKYYCFAATLSGSAKPPPGEGVWWLQYGTSEGKFCDVHVYFPKKKISVGSTAGHGLMPRSELQHPIGYGLEKAQDRLGPRKEEFHCIGAYYDQGSGDWSYWFQSGTSKPVSVSTNGNVWRFIETCSNETPDPDELTADLPEAKSDELPYGSEELNPSELKINDRGGNLEVSLPVVCLPEGFIALETGSSVAQDGTFILVYQVRYRSGYGGVGREKDAVWKLKKPDSGVPKFRIIHKPTQVVVKTPEKHD